MRHDGDARAILGGVGPAAVAVAVDLLPAALAGTTAPLLPLGPDEAAPPDPVPAPPGAAALLRTSGSGGRRRLVALAGPTLVASARATHERLGGPGRWVLALPIHHVAGLQVLVRAHLAGAAGVDRPLVVAGTGDGFRPAELVRALATLPDDGVPRYTALVPTQLERVLRQPAAAAALAGVDAVLLGGAAPPPGLLARARAAGVNAVVTYGMTETAGGCVYDGVPLAGIDVGVVDGRLVLAGPTLALGYVTPAGALDDGGGGDPGATAFVVRDGRRVLLTADLGEIDAAGRVHVLGRADDVLVTGGEKVHPLPVERLLGAVPGVAEALVVGIPDPEWGQSVTALLVLEPGAAAPRLAELRSLVTARLGRAHAPRGAVVVERLPLRGPGKPDRQAAATLAAGILAGPVDV